MIPNGAEGIGHIVARIFGDLVPKASDAYAMSDLAMIATLLGMAAEDYDRAADVLLADEAEIVEIFDLARIHVVDEQLRQRMTGAIVGPPESYRVSQLSARVDAAMRVLIALHEAVEVAQESGAGWAEVLNGRIWSFLERHTERRAYHAAF
jgi:hypothetical protein